MSEREGAVLFSKYEVGTGMARCFEMTPQQVIDQIRQSGLRGRGGAGFPVAAKWHYASIEQRNEQEIPPEFRYVVCNADEGEPGTFKDRVLLEEYLELMLEGMIIAGYAIGSAMGVIYLRGEYIYLEHQIRQTISRWKEENRLGENIKGTGFSFHVRIRMGAGAYVCGEETALIESMEGFRGEPRNRPPYPVNVGFEANPTIVNNVETFCCVPHIIAQGGQWFSSLGTEKSTGTKLISVSGDVNKPGVYEIPFGTPVREVLDLVGAADVKAVQVGGASGSIVPESEFSRRICFEDLPTGGSIIVLNQSRNMRDVLKNFMEFFVDESCGQCTPCRYGNECLLDGIHKMEQGVCSEEYLNELLELCETMTNASKCGLGQSAPNPFKTFVQHFHSELMTTGH